jgi:hypothetical protein
MENKVETENIEDGIYVTRFPGWPIVLQQSLVFSQLDDDEFRIACAYLSKDEFNEDKFEALIGNYDPAKVAEVISWVRAEGITRNG